MEIQRQSDYYGLDRPEFHAASLSADQIADFTKGVGIPTGMLNTRTAWREGEPWTYDPAMHVPEEDVYEPTQEELDEQAYLDDLDNHIPEDLVEGGEEPLYVHDSHTPAPWLLPDYEDEEEDEDEDALEPVGHGQGPNLDAMLNELVRRQISASEIDNELLQAEGEEIEGIGMYNQFLEDAQAAGDEHAEAVISEALQDEHDHVNNFANALQGREAYYRHANPAAALAIGEGVSQLAQMGQHAADEFANEGARSKAALDEAVASERYL